LHIFPVAQNDSVFTHIIFIAQLLSVPIAVICHGTDPAPEK